MKNEIQFNILWFCWYKSWKFKEKLSFARVLLTNVQNAMSKLSEMNIMKKGGLQIETDIWFMEHAMKNSLVKSAQTVFVKLVMYLLMNTVIVILLNNFFLEKMKCLLCRLICSSEKVLKKHYVNYHQIKENDAHFKDLLLPDALEKKFKFCDIIFKTCRQKKNTYVFLSLWCKKETVWWKSKKCITN